MSTSPTIDELADGATAHRQVRPASRGHLHAGRTRIRGVVDRPAFRGTGRPRQSICELPVVAQGIVDTAAQKPKQADRPPALERPQCRSDKRRPCGTFSCPRPQAQSRSAARTTPGRAELYATDFSGTAPRPVRQQPTWPRPHLNVTTIRSATFSTPSIWPGKMSSRRRQVVQIASNMERPFPQVVWCDALVRGLRALKHREQLLANGVAVVAGQH
jgi:hypothetical protein